MAEMEVPQHRTVITNCHGEKLVGMLHETGSKGLVILCHGFRSSKDENSLLNLAEVLTRDGISTFRFDFAGNGESEGSFHYGNYRKEADDLRAVVQHFSGKQREIIAIAGHSKDKGIDGRLGKDFMQRVKEAGFIDVKDKTGQVEYRVTVESLMDRLSTDMHAACLSIDKDCRVMTIHGSLDEIIPVEDALEFAKLIPNHKLHIIDGANHSYTKHQAELASVVLDFLRSNQVMPSPRGERFIESSL
uniref:Serine aminopeptidase S33 domain-containing protein n=1 Tax=Anthurium amnicola TaxID=1678845 RepID=A0A1D1YI22_9ARAE